MIIEKIHGLIAAPFSPMDYNGEINPSIISKYSNKLKTDGIIGVFICGTTGEGLSLTIQERKVIAEEWVKYQNSKFKVIVHVGSTSIKQSKELAKHAQKIGAYATSAIGPLFLKPNNINDLVSFCEEIASESPDIPFFYYHIPSVSGIDLSMIDFIKLAKTKIHNFSGIKYTHNNFMEMQQCLKIDNGKWNILHGLDEILIAGLSFGINGAVGSTYNYLGVLYNSIVENFKMGNIETARINQQLSVKVLEKLIKFKGPIVAGKQIMKLIGLDCGPCRLPLTNLSKNDILKLNEELKLIGFYKIIE
tara:strand:+ start:150 stop:1064 length:915 start_codon:yes stop_codon:yes gene_type:complete